MGPLFSPLNFPHAKRASLGSAVLHDGAMETPSVFLPWNYRTVHTGDTVSYSEALELLVEQRGAQPLLPVHTADDSYTLMLANQADAVLAGLISNPKFIISELEAAELMKEEYRRDDFVPIGHDRVVVKPSHFLNPTDAQLMLAWETARRNSN